MSSDKREMDFSAMQILSISVKCKQEKNQAKPKQTNKIKHAPPQQ